MATANNNNSAADKFNQVLTVIQEILKSRNDSKEEHIIKRLKLLFDRISAVYKDSDEFFQNLCGYLAKSQSLKEPAYLNSDEIYKLIKEIIDEMKSNEQASTAPKNLGASADSGAGSSGNGSARQSLKRRQLIGQLEKHLITIEKKIKEYGLVELSMDDLDQDDNAYEKLLKLKQKYLTDLDKLRKLENETPVKLPRPTYTGSGYDAIDRAITKLLRPTGKELSTRPFEAPNYADIKQAITQTNTSENLKLSNEDIEKLSMDVGEDVVKLLMARTVRDANEYLQNVQSEQAIPNEFPEASDPELSEKLNRNNEKIKTIEKEDKKKFELAVVENGAAADNGDAEPADECHISDKSEDSDDDVDEEGNGQEKDEEDTAEDNGDMEVAVECQESDISDDDDSEEEEKEGDETDTEEVVEVSGIKNGDEDELDETDQGQDTTGDSDDSSIIIEDLMETNSPEEEEHDSPNVFMKFEVNRKPEKRKLDMPDSTSSTTNGKKIMQAEIETVDLSDDD